MSFSGLLKTTLAERKERPEPRVFGTYWTLHSCSGAPRSASAIAELPSVVLSAGWPAARAHWPASGFQNTTGPESSRKLEPARS